MSKALGEHEFIVGDATSPPLKENSVHAIVTDPPYGLAFMGKTWDDFEPKEYQEWCEDWGEEALKVIKPGGHLLAFSGTRTFHRLHSGIEDAGFEIRDTLMWLYGEGFPKSMSIPKKIDEKLGVEREVVGTEEVDVGMQSGSLHAGREQEVVEREKTIATSPQAQKWEGFGTALKPAFEPIVLARKPLEESTIAENVMKFGTGGLNIDETRIPSDNMPERHEGKGFKAVMEKNEEHGYRPEDYYKDQDGYEYIPSEEGRHPANIILDEKSSEMIDNQGGESKSSKTSSKGGWDTPDVYNDRERPEEDGVEYERGYEDEGGPSRYYKRVKNQDDSSYFGGIKDEDSEPGVPWGQVYSDSGGPSRFYYTSKANKSERTHDGKIENLHPTVKPVDLMEWLVKLVTAEGQTVLDPFVGSGTTLLACDNTHRKGIGIDMNPEWVEISRKRMLANRGRLETNSIQDW